MNQDNMDDKIKDIFGSLDKQDLLAAQESKERIWSRTQVGKSEKKKNNWWLLLLLGGLLFASGWFLSPKLTNELAPKQEQKTPEQPRQDASKQLALNKANSLMQSQQKSLDSLQALNTSLYNRLLAAGRHNKSIAVQQLTKKQRTLRDTVYLTQVKVEQRIIEKVIRDTIILEVPSIQVMEPMADVSENIPDEIVKEEPIAKTAAYPSSVKFNFTETSHIDK